MIIYLLVGPMNLHSAVRFQHSDLRCMITNSNTLCFLLFEYYHFSFHLHLYLSNFTFIPFAGFFLSVFSGHFHHFISFTSFIFFILLDIFVFIHSFFLLLLIWYKYASHFCLIFYYYNSPADPLHKSILFWRS